MKIKVLITLFFAVNILLHAQQSQDSLKVQQLDEVVITNSKTPLKRTRSGKVITKVTQAQLKNLEGKTVADIVNTISSIEINGNTSYAGQNLSYFVRGGRNRQVLILIDGIAVTDASSIANDYDLRLLNSNQIESIEVQKGASSTLYGSGAATAVINIKLKEALKNKANLNVTSSLGTNQNQDQNQYRLQDFLNNVSVNGSLNKFKYLASFGHQSTNGLSAVTNGSETDPYNAINGQLKLGYAFSNNLKLNTYASFDRFNAAIDNALFFDVDETLKSKQHRIGIAPKYKYNKGEFTINAAYNNIERDATNTNFPAIYDAESVIIDAFNNYNFNTNFNVVLGVNYHDSNMNSFTIPFDQTSLTQDIHSSIASFNTIDPYVNAVYTTNFGLTLNGGLRLNNHSEYGSHLVYAINPSYKLDTRFGYVKPLASYSTAYIVPSLFQLFNTNYGNTNLEPEENETLEIGIETAINNKARLSLVYFNRNEKNVLNFVDTGNFVFQYQNINERFNASGLEFESNVNLNNWNIAANLTYTKVEDNLNLRIPELKANAVIDYTLNNTFFSLRYQYNANREDGYFDINTFSTVNVTLESYSLLDFYAKHTVIKDTLSVFANFSNVLNEDYQELFGYTTKGRNFALGFNLKL